MSSSIASVYGGAILLDKTTNGPSPLILQLEVRVEEFDAEMPSRRGVTMIWRDAMVEDITIGEQDAITI